MCHNIAPLSKNVNKNQVSFYYANEKITKRNEKWATLNESKVIFRFLRVGNVQVSDD